MLKTISKKDIKKEILNLNVTKASYNSDVPTKTIKKNSDIFSDILFKKFNKSLEICKFPSCLKMANVTPVYKKENRSDEDKYHRVSILPNLSKNFETCLCKPISTFLRISFLSNNVGLGRTLCSTLLTSTNWEVETVWIMERFLGRY